jgi:hypothetical protein
MCCVRATFKVVFLKMKFKLKEDIFDTHYHCLGIVFASMRQERCIIQPVAQSVYQVCGHVFIV